MTVIGRFALVAWITVSLAGGAIADDAYDQATRTAIRDVITQQLDALAHEDAAKAETFAASGIRQKFPEPKK